MKKVLVVLFFWGILGQTSYSQATLFDGWMSFSCNYLSDNIYEYSYKWGASTTLSQEEIDNWGLPLAGTIPEDPLIAEYDGLGKPTVNLPADSIAVKAVNEIFGRLVK